MDGFGQGVWGWVPWFVAVALAVIAFIAPRRPANFSSEKVFLLALGAVATGILWSVEGWRGYIALPVGLLFSVCLLDFDADDEPLMRAIPFGLAALAMTVVYPALQGQVHHAFLFLAGAAFGGVMLRVKNPRPTPHDAVLALAAVLTVTALGSIRDPNSVGQAGPALLLAGLLACVFASLAGGDRRGITMAVSVVTFAGASWVLIARALGDAEAAGLAAAGALFGALTVWILGDKETTARASLVAVAWLAGASVAFGTLRGYGMAIAVAAGICVAIVLGKRSAAAAMSPVLALAIYRVFRETNEEVSRAFDIGQQYSIVGILIGVAIVLGAAHWYRESNKSLGGMIPTGLLVVGLATVSMLFLGAKGSVGLLVGLGLAPALIAMTGAWSVNVSTLAVGLLCFAVALFGPLNSAYELDQGQKQNLVVLAAVAGVILAAIAGWLGRDRSRPEAEVAAA